MYCARQTGENDRMELDRSHVNLFGVSAYAFYVD